MRLACVMDNSKTQLIPPVFPRNEAYANKKMFYQVQTDVQEHYFMTRIKALLIHRAINQYVKLFSIL